MTQLVVLKKHNYVLITHFLVTVYCHVRGQCLPRAATGVTVAIDSSTELNE